MDSRYSLFLIKPDGVARQLQDSVVNAARAAGLTVVCRHSLRLDETAITRAWADTRRDEHPLEHLSLDLWYGDRPVEVVVVGGHDAFAVAGRVKSKVRSSYRQGPFANVVHTPDHQGEFDLQLSVFGEGCPTCAPLVGTDFGDYGAVPQAFPQGTLLPARWRDAAVLREITLPMWDDPDSHFWRAARPPLYRSREPDVRRDHVVYLAQSPNQLSFDNLVGALLVTLPDITLPHAFELILAALHHGDFAFAAGSRAEAERFSRGLTDQGLNAPVRPLSPAESERLDTTRTLHYTAALAGRTAGTLTAVSAA